MAAEREKEADKLMKKANKEIGPSLLEFRFKPDYESAAPMFERAAVIYKVHTTDESTSPLAWDPMAHTPLAWDPMHGACLS